MQANDILNRVSEVVQELGPVSNISHLQHGIHEAVKTGNDPVVYGDVYLSQAIAANATYPFWVNNKIIPHLDKFTQDNYQFSFLHKGRLPLKKLGSPQAALCIVVLDENLLNEKETVEYLKRNSSVYSMMVVLNFTKNDRLSRELKFDFTGKMHSIEAHENDKVFHVLLDELITPEAKTKLVQRSAYNTIKPLLSITKEAIQKEQKLVSTRKIVNGQLGGVLKKDEYQSNISDIMSQAKSQFLSWNSDAEKNIKSKYDELNKPLTGKYSINISDWSQELKEVEKEDIAEKSERWATYISKDFLKDYENKVKSQLQGDFANDYNALLSSADSSLGKINFILSQKGIADQNNKIQIDYGRFPDPEKTLTNYVAFSRLYSGEMVKKGAVEYFIALREYTGLIMVVTGLLAPLYMIAAISQNSFMKSMSVGLRIAIGVITLIMIVYGYFDLRKRIPRRRKEEQERELRRAKENLVTEGKRMSNDSSKDWQANLSLWLREIQNQFVFQLDKLAKEFSLQQQQKLNDEKQKLQRMNQGLDNNSKRINNAEKLMENTIKTFDDKVNDIEKYFRN
jgi:hypothetical protein